MIRKLLTVACLIALPLVSALAQQKPDFSGTWKLNVDKSDFGALPPTANQISVVVHKEPTIASHITAEGPQGKLDYTANYSTDGKETINTAGDFVTKSTAKWDGNNLVINTKLKYNDTDVVIVTTWALAADGKTLTLTVHVTSVMGETDQKLFFEKQEGAAAAPTKS